MAKALMHFSVTVSDEGYVLHLEDEDGDVTELTATYDQLDLVAEAIDEQLDGDEEDALGIDDDEDEAEDEQ